MACEPSDSTEECAQVDVALSISIVLPDDDFAEEFDVSVDGMLEVVDADSFRVVGDTGPITVDLEGTTLPAFQSSSVRLRVFSDFGSSSAEVEYVELVDVETNALLFAAQWGDPSPVPGARVQVSNKEYCFSSEGGGGDDASSSNLKVVVSVDGVETPLAAKSTQVLPDLGVEVEHQGSALTFLYDFVEANSGIVVRAVE